MFYSGFGLIGGQVSYCTMTSFLHIVVPYRPINRWRWLISRLIMNNQNYSMVLTDLPTLPHWAEAFRISRPASDLPHFHKIFRFQLKSDQHVFPVWTAMQLTWLSTSYHDHSSLSCPLISWGSVKTETLPALCNKNNKPIDLIHLRCGWQLTLLRKGRAYMVSQENAPHQTLCLTENVSFPNMHTLQTQTGTEIVTLKCLKKRQMKLYASYIMYMS